ncbi:helix-turn-helix transcriptional regulator [Halobacillus sp. BAB-2008]|uniref:helix-turn-helix domain-containing protein n=1 Tax=Halobacillus sp. BAB-2008 TaxID=1246484 RepID=UPI0002A5027A|nr:helix-turn-helix transcriptional regulator [Halobacillus sp. BAB-2008]ELK47217.1 XRE family transcriptional regulator [Halobacillus sp. BAB-2008]
MRNNLRNVRIEKGFKDVEELAGLLGISASYYYKIEQGKRTPSINLAKNIADELDHTVDELFFNNKLDVSSRCQGQSITKEVI